MASGISTAFLLENPNEFCDRLNLLLREKQAGNDSDITNADFIAIADKLKLGNLIYLKNKCHQNHKRQF